MSLQKGLFELADGSLLTQLQQCQRKLADKNQR
jgi:hypothetical protein